MTLTCYLGSIGLFVLGALLIGNTSPFSDRVALTMKEKDTQDRGRDLLIAGALLLGLAMLSQFVAGLQ